MIYLVTFILFISYAFSIPCIDKLLPFSNHSGTHSIEKLDWDAKNELSLQNIDDAYRSLVFKKLFCHNDEINLSQPPQCTTLNPQTKLANVCYIKSNLGHFIVSRDRNGNANFIFQRLEISRSEKNSINLVPLVQD